MYFSVAITIIIIPCVLYFVNNKAGGIDNPFVLVGSKAICCVCRSKPTANLWRRCHLPVVAGVLLETNLGIFTEGNCRCLHLNVLLWVTNEGALIRTIRAFLMGGPEDFGVRTGGLIRPLDL